MNVSVSALPPLPLAAARAADEAARPEPRVADAPPRTATAGPADAADTAPPAFHLQPWVHARAVGGFAGLGLAAGLAGQTDALARAPAGLVAAAGVVLLAAPALVVGHQYLRMRAAPGALLAAVADAFARAGVVALGGVPAVVWLAATSDLGPMVGLLGLLGVGTFALFRVLVNLVRVEGAAGGSVEAATGFALLWTGLAALIGLRLLFTFFA